MRQGATSVQYGSVPPDADFSEGSEEPETLWWRIREWIACGTQKCLKLTAVGAILAVLVCIVLRTLLVVSNAQGGERYDFIIVGAGPAGSVLARLLSDDQDLKVLLLEAGDVSQYDLGGRSTIADAKLTPFDVPLLWPSVTKMPNLHWHEMEVNSIMVAKALGGCGIHNAMLYVRAIEADLIRWNLSSWTWEDTLATYLKLEHWVGEPVAYHGLGGPITTSPPLYVDEAAPLFVDSAKQAGVPLTQDFNAPGGRVGVGYYHFNIKGGIRDSAARAMLAPVLKTRPNLNVKLKATVKRVLLENAPNDALQDEPMNAIGVEFEQGGSKRIAYLNRASGQGDALSHTRAVLLTAGALMTPKLLMASGIGHREALLRNEIECSVHIPAVGKNLQDHPAIGLTYEVLPVLTGGTPSAFSIGNLFLQYVDAVTRFKEVQSHGHNPVLDYGVFASSGLSAGAFLVSPYSQAGVPDIQVTVFSRVTEPHVAYNVANSTVQAGATLLITVALLLPEARHVVVLNSTDPKTGGQALQVKPETAGYLSELDVARLAWGLETVRDIKSKPPLGLLTGREVAPGEGIQGLAINSWIKQNYYHNSHWCGSAAMGEDPKTSVVDQKLQVRGVAHLRVADASVIPSIPNGNVHSTVVMIAARAAEMLLKSKRGG